MRHIRQNNQPEALIRCKAFRRENRQPLNYDEVGQVEVGGEMVSVTTEIRKARCKDQGYICAYTMLRIDVSSSHNEHLVPRSKSKASGNIEETLDYGNIVACYPGEEKRGGTGFGATLRGDVDLVLTPMDPACEVRLKFD